MKKSGLVPGTNPKIIKKSGLVPGDFQTFRFKTKATDFLYGGTPKALR